MMSISTNMRPDIALRQRSSGSCSEQSGNVFLIGGHRGMGENLWVEGRAAATPAASPVVPAERENTVRSFVRAAQMGVSFIEFDVQVTSDGVPVIWHDDDVVVKHESNTMHHVSRHLVKDITLESFKQLVPTPASTEENQESKLLVSQLVRRFKGAASRSFMPESTVLPWMCDQDDYLPTLAELFQKVPSSCAFNIEIKVATPHDQPRTAPEEIARMVDAIWQVVLDSESNSNSGGILNVNDGSGEPRSIFFSSFDPDVCEAIAAKQQRYQVWFLSECGLEEHADERRMSFETAVRLAVRQGLNGIVVPAKALLARESMVREARDAGLGIRTYGLDNNDLPAVERQRELGVWGIIVDDVQGVMSQLTVLEVHAGSVSRPGSPCTPFTPGDHHLVAPSPMPPSSVMSEEDATPLASVASSVTSDD